jgi:hypothetical protein
MHSPTTRCRPTSKTSHHHGRKIMERANSVDYLYFIQGQHKEAKDHSLTLMHHFHRGQLPTEYWTMHEPCSCHIWTWCNRQEQQSPLAQCLRNEGKSHRYSWHGWVDWAPFCVHQKLVLGHHQFSMGQDKGTFKCTVLIRWTEADHGRLRRLCDSRCRLCKSATLKLWIWCLTATGRF